MRVPFAECASSRCVCLSVICPIANLKREVHVQCDGVAPACSTCTKHDRADTCSLRSKQHGQDQDYTGYLERRIRFLEERLTGSLSGEELDEEESADFTKLVNEVDATSLALPSESQHGFPLSQIIIASACVGSLSEGEAQETELSFPQKDTGSKLIGYYLEHIHAVTIPFISVQSIRAQFDLVYSSSTEAGSYHNDYNTACFNVFMIMAIATTSLSQKGRSILLSTARAFFCRASRLFCNYLVSSETLIETIQGLLFLIQYGMLNPPDVHVSYVINVGVRMCVDLQLHHNLETNDETQQVSRKLHWAMYTFDRSYCIARSVPCTFPDGGWQPHDYEENPLYHAQKCRIIQLQSAIFDKLHTNSEVSLDSVECFATRLATWDQQNTQITSIHLRRLLRREFYHAMILLYRPCHALKKRPPEHLLQLWNYSLEFAQTQREFAEETLDLTTSAEWAFIAGIALIYSYKEIVHGNDNQYATQAAAAVRLSLLWTGLQNVSHILRLVSQQWTDAKNILHRFEYVVKESITAVENLINSREAIIFPSDVNDMWKHASVSSDLSLGREIRHREQDGIGELVWDVILSWSETGQQHVN